MQRRPLMAGGFSGAFLCLVVLASEHTNSDWPMWGGTPDRNMVSAMPGLPTSWDAERKLNVMWTAKLGSQTYSSPVVAGGRVYIGTNNEFARDPEHSGDRGVLLCFRESDGQLLWQHTHERLEDSHMDWPETGLCSTPLVEDARVYYVSNRGEVVALDSQGDGNGGSRVVWTFDMLKELGVVPYQKVSSSPVSYGDLIYVNTSNGINEKGEVPSPDAPTIVALNKTSGKPAWKANSIKGRILSGQWSSPAVGIIGDVAQVVIGEGDGWVRGYEALKGDMLWEFNTNPEEAVWPRTAGIVLASPVIWQNKVFVANGQDPESSQGSGHLYAIDATQRGDVTASGLIWRYADIERSISTVAIYDGLLFAADVSGYLHCLDVDTGTVNWIHDTFAGIWASPMVIDGKVYLGTTDGEIFVLEASREKKELFQTNMGSSVFSPVVPANGKLFVASRTTLFALAKRDPS